MFVPRKQCNSSVAPSGFDRLLSEHRLPHTALLVNPPVRKRLIFFHGREPWQANFASLLPASAFPNIAPHVFIFVF